MKIRALLISTIMAFSFFANASGNCAKAASKYATQYYASVAEYGGSKNLTARSTFIANTKGTATYSATVTGSDEDYAWWAIYTVELWEDACDEISTKKLAGFRMRK